MAVLFFISVKNFTKRTKASEPVLEIFKTNLILQMCFYQTEQFHSLPPPEDFLAPSGVEFEPVPEYP